MKSEETKTPETIDVEYPKAGLSKRWFSGIIDLFLVVLLGALFYALAQIVTNHFSSYTDVLEKRDELKLSSHLYVTDNDQVTLILQSEEDSKDTDEAKKTTLSNAIDYFYQDPDFFTDDSAKTSYESRKASATDSSGDLIFRYDASSKTYAENGYSDQIYYDFYSTEIGDYSLALLSRNADYAWTSQVIVLTSVTEAFLSGGLGFILAFGIVPLILKRGRKTLGMYLFRISLIGSDALNVSGGKFFGRFCLLFLVGYVLDCFTVLIPLAVSVTMMHLSSSGQDFFDYVTNTYVVDTKDRDVYLDYSEYFSRVGMKSEATLENNDLKLTDRK
jgi:hypothetical protein